MTDINTEVKNPLTQVSSCLTLNYASDILLEMNELQNFMGSCAIAGLTDSGVEILDVLLQRQSTLLSYVTTAVHYNLKPIKFKV